eukprot:COSAG01_NODE_4983_length_4570_cov_5.034444_3_plen_92_part_00
MEVRLTEDIVRAFIAHYYEKLEEAAAAGGAGAGEATDADLVCLFTVRVVGAGSAPPPPLPPDDFVSRVSAAVSDWDPPVGHAAVPVKGVLG